MSCASVPHLQKGDLIRIISPAKAIEKKLIDEARLFFEQRGFRVKIGAHASNTFNYFSGNDKERLKDFQEALDDVDCKAIVCARGGYGSIRIVGDIDWHTFGTSPKWICGFSDITVLHQCLYKMGYSSLHCTMPLNFSSNSQEALDSMLNVLTGKTNSYQVPASAHNILGEAEGVLVGGNLSILYSLLGTELRVDYENTLLFIEDVGEQLYAIDRMLFSLEKANIFKQIKGLIVGGMSDLKDTQVPTGFSVEAMVLQHTSKASIPVCFQFPAGHISDNRALILGRKARIQIGEKQIVFEQ